ncbi:hypothetical protein AB0L71_05070 [Streptomyces sp. NPDC052052]|uniref:hypothetical protein n=1 Tax=Streptomyces sp. NPDC052052 TaxID=3154756 RepID=UPI00341B2A70
MRRPQGDRVTDAAELDELDNLTAEEGAVVVPRGLLANFGPKEPVDVPQFITFDGRRSGITAAGSMIWYVPYTVVCGEALAPRPDWAATWRVGGSEVVCPEELTVDGGGGADTQVYP